MVALCFKHSALRKKVVQVKRQLLLRCEVSTLYGAVGASTWNHVFGAFGNDAPQFYYRELTNVTTRLLNRHYLISRDIFDHLNRPPHLISSTITAVPMPNSNAMLSIDR